MKKGLRSKKGTIFGLNFFVIVIIICFVLIIGMFLLMKINVLSINRKITLLHKEEHDVSRLSHFLSCECKNGMTIMEVLSVIDKVDENTKILLEKCIRDCEQDADVSIKKSGKGDFSITLPLFSSGLPKKIGVDVE